MQINAYLFDFDRNKRNGVDLKTKKYDYAGDGLSTPLLLFKRSTYALLSLSITLKL